MNKGHVSNEMFANRVSCHGKITEAQILNGFKLAEHLPFSICIVPKQATTNVILIVDLKLYHDDNSSDFPCVLNDWTPGAIVELAPESIDLLTYDVYWAAGSYATPE